MLAIAYGARSGAEQSAHADFVRFQPRFQPKSCNPQPQEGSAALRGATLSRPERILDEWKADGE
jgi:hypothetical protein